MAELNALEIAQIQDVVHQVRENTTKIRAIQKYLITEQETWLYLLSQHSAEEIDAALAGSNAGITTALMTAAFAALVAVGETIDENRAPLIAISFGGTK